MQKLVLRVIFNLLFEEWSAIWSQLARRNVRPAYLGYFCIFAFYFCILFSQASNMVKFIDKCSRVSGIYCAVFISYSLSNCLVMLFFFFFGGGGGFTNFLVEFFFSNQDINLIYLPCSFLFPCGILPFLGASLGYGFRSYRLSSLVRSWTSFMKSSCIVVRFYFYVQRNVTIISEKYSHHPNMQVAKRAGQPGICMWSCSMM